MSFWCGSQFKRDEKNENIAGKLTSYNSYMGTVLNRLSFACTSCTTTPRSLICHHIAFFIA